MGKKKIDIYKGPMLWSVCGPDGRSGPHERSLRAARAMSGRPRGYCQQNHVGAAAVRRAAGVQQMSGAGGVRAARGRRV